MLQKLFLFLIVVFTGTSLFAYNSGDLILAPGAGIGMSSASSKAWDSNSMKLAYGQNFKNPESQISLTYNVGMMFDVFIAENFSLTTGVAYEKMPYKVKYAKVTAPTDLEITFDYSFLTVPLGLYYYINEIVMLGSGVYFGKILSKDAEIKYSSKKTKVDLSSKNDVGLFFDFGLNLPVADNGSILTFLRLKKGLKKVYDEEDMVTDVKITALTVQAAYGIKF